MLHECASPVRRADNLATFMCRLSSNLCSDSQAALKALRAVRTTSPLVRQFQEAEDISTWHAMGLNWVPGHAGVRGNETADGLARNGSASDFVGPVSALEVSQQDLWSRIKRWLGNQHQRRWWNLGDSQRQARELISRPSQGTRIRLLPLSRAQSRVVTGLLTWHKTLPRHLHLMGLTDSPLCRKCGAEDETSAHILCRCEALASIRQAHLGSFFLEPEDIKSQTLGAIWRFSKDDWGTKGQIKRPRCIRAGGFEPICQSSSCLQIWEPQPPGTLRPSPGL
jgi:hypothetical protein